MTQEDQMSTSLIATTPTQMQAITPRVIDWCDKRIEAANHEWSLASATFNSLLKAGYRTHPAQALMNKATKRIRFYEKVKSAIQAGYVIVPPFDLQLFAIRTKSDAPRLDRNERGWVKEQPVMRLSEGEGEFRNARVSRFKVDTITKKNSAGNEYKSDVYENADDWEELELPVRAMKPEIIDAIDQAQQLRIFDALGIAPNYRSADPVICGQIRRPEGPGVLTFFIAWWLDESDL